MSASQMFNTPTYFTTPLWLQMTLYQTVTIATSTSNETS